MLLKLFKRRVVKLITPADPALADAGFEVTPPVGDDGVTDAVKIHRVSLVEL
jgi:hypothetical protein